LQITRHRARNDPFNMWPNSFNSKKNYDYWPIEQNDDVMFKPKESYINNQESLAIEKWRDPNQDQILNQNEKGKYD
jgi:hypothetical protein